MDKTRNIIRRMLTESVEDWKDLTEKVAAIMVRAPADENSGPVEDGVMVFVSEDGKQMRVDVGDWFGNYEWFEEHVAAGLPDNSMTVEVTDEAGSPSWDYKRVFP